ncbi:MAG: hypothetical protein ACKN9J_05695 [Holophagaceae bacterium]
MTDSPFQLPTEFIDQVESLRCALPIWKQSDVLAVDLENSLTGMHHCNLALLQIATHNQVWLVDSLTLADHLPETLEAIRHIPWICHDFSNDGIVLKRLYDFVPDSVFDTMLLAKALGYPQPGLKAVAKIKLGIEVDKEEQDSNWVLRPLRESQLRYAAQDAALLLPLLRRLADEVEERKEEPDVQARVAQLPQEMEALFKRIRAYQRPVTEPVVEKAAYWGEEAEAIARKFCELRVRWGNNGDVGAIMEMGNRWILQCAEQIPVRRDQFDKTIRNPRFLRAHGDELWSVIEPYAEQKRSKLDEDLLWTNS